MSSTEKRHQSGHKPAIASVPTNVIAGFLGVGKTTVILNLLQRKPSTERWAVLMNEFGEVGVDGSLIKGKHGENHGVFIREVPGGCMCCTAGLPMQVALNQLLKKARPDRLLIEPTGLGHPKEVLQALCADHYQDVLDIQQCITLVDARKIADARYTGHDTFKQQIDMADLIIGHKADLYGDGERQNLMAYIAKRRGPETPVYFVQQGDVGLDMLSGKSSMVATLNSPRHHHHHHHSAPVHGINNQQLPQSGMLKVENSGEGFKSVGWRFSPDKIFNRQSLWIWMNGLTVERAKGVFNTDDGVWGYNVTADGTTEVPMNQTRQDEGIESRIEIIGAQLKPEWEEQLIGCIAPDFMSVSTRN